MIPIAQTVAAISYLWLTITSDIETREFLEVGVLKTLMVSVHGAHYSRPGPLEYLQQNTENTRKQKKGLTATIASITIMKCIYL